MEPIIGPWRLAQEHRRRSAPQRPRREWGTVLRIQLTIRHPWGLRGGAVLSVSCTRLTEVSGDAMWAMGDTGARGGHWPLEPRRHTYLDSRMSGAACDGHGHVHVGSWRRVAHGRSPCTRTTMYFYFYTT